MARFFKGLDRGWTLIGRLAIVMALGVVCFVAWRDIVGDTVSVEPISVPKDLADAGMGPDVVAKDIRSDLLSIAESATTTMHHANVSAGAARGVDAPDIVVPGAGLSVSSLTSWINTRLLTENVRARFHLPRRKVISGEITELDKRYEICVRLNDQVIYRSSAPVARQGLEREIGEADKQIARRTMPFIYASYLYSNMSSDSASRNALAVVLNWIVTTLPDSDENVVRAHNLYGLLLGNQGDISGALVEFRLANSLAERAEIDDFESADLNIAEADLRFARQALLAARDAGDQATADRGLKSAADLLAQARTYATRAQAKARGRSHPLLALADVELATAQYWQQSGDEAAANRHLAAQRHDFDEAVSLEPEQPEGYWNRANLLVSKTQVHDIVQAVADRYRALDLMRVSRQGIHDSSRFYLILKDDLLEEIDEIGKGKLDAAPPKERWLVMAGNEMAVAPAAAEEAPPDPAEIAQRRDQRREALLIEACQALHAATQRWDAQYDASVTWQDLTTSALLLAKEGADLGYQVPACLAWPQT